MHSHTVPSPDLGYASLALSSPRPSASPWMSACASLLHWQSRTPSSEASVREIRLRCPQVRWTESPQVNNSTGTEDKKRRAIAPSRTAGSDSCNWEFRLRPLLRCMKLVFVLGITHTTAAIRQEDTTWRPLQPTRIPNIAAVESQAENRTRCSWRSLLWCTCPFYSNHSSHSNLRSGKQASEHCSAIPPTILQECQLWTIIGCEIRNTQKQFSSTSTYPRTSMQIPFHLKRKNAREHTNPFSTTSKAIKLGTRSYPGIMDEIRTDSIMNVNKNPLTAAAHAK